MDRRAHHLTCASATFASATCAVDCLTAKHVQGTMSFAGVACVKTTSAARRNRTRPTVQRTIGVRAPGAEATSAASARMMTLVRLTIGARVAIASKTSVRQRRITSPHVLRTMRVRATGAEAASVASARMVSPAYGMIGA